MSLPGADVRERLQVKEELRGVCEYACLRKDTSKAGSVLILRFFHGFYPKEIAKILRSPLRLANDWLRIARHEARAYLEHPSTLRFLPHANRSSGPPNVPVASADGGADAGSCAPSFARGYAAHAPAIACRAPTWPACTPIPARKPCAVQR
jgi:hypothetical protein